MNTNLARTVVDGFPKYPSAQLLGRVQAFASSLPGRLAAARRVEALEGPICGQAVDAALAAFPNFARQHQAARDKCVRDVELVFRNAVLAMVADDVAYQDDKMLTWLATILGSVGMTPDFCRVTYEALREAAGAHLEPPDLELLRPHLDRVVEKLGSLPEPHQPRV